MFMVACDKWQVHSCGAFLFLVRFMNFSANFNLKSEQISIMTFEREKNNLRTNKTEAQ